MSQPPADRFQDTTSLGASQVVLSPEQVRLHLPVSGPTSRILAYGIDLAVIFAIDFGLFVCLFLTTPLLAWMLAWVRQIVPDPANLKPEALVENAALYYLAAVLLVAQLVVEWGYFVLCELTTSGRSLGKAILRLRVVRDGGLPIGPRESLVRNLLRMVDMLPANYLVGLVSMVLSPEGKRLGDLAAGTVVVRLDRPERAAPLGDSATDAAFRFDRVQIARVGPAERALVRETLRRLDGLPPAAAEAALERSVEALRARLGYEPVDPARRRAFLHALLEAARLR